MAEPAKDQLDALKKAIAERRYDEAIRGARRVVLESDEHPEARLLLGEALLAAGRNDEARVEMLALVRERPDESAGHRLLGEAYLRDAQLEAARASLRRAVELDPDDETARDLLLEADSEVIAPVSSTVERWMGDAEPATTEMAMPEYLEQAPAASPSASLRALLERAAPKKVPVPVPRPGAAGITTKTPAVKLTPPPSVASVEVDLEASTGQRATPEQTAPVRAPVPADERTGEIALEELDAAPLAKAPSPPARRSAPPPPRSGSTSPGAIASPAPADAPTRAGPRPPQRAAAPLHTSTLSGMQSPVAPPAGAPSLAHPPSAPPPPRSAPPPAPPPGSARPRSIPPAPGAPKPRSIPPAALPPAASARPASARSASAQPASPRTPEPEEAPTRPALRAEEPLASPPTMITGPHGVGGDDAAGITLERRPVQGTPAWPSVAPIGAAAGAIPAASPPPKLGSLAQPQPAQASYGAAQPYGAQPYTPQPHAAQPYPQPHAAPAQPARPVAAQPRPYAGPLAPSLGGAHNAQQGLAEPTTKPTLRAPGSRGEATQRIRLTQMTVALVLSAVVAIALVVAVTRWLSAREREEALAAASDNGTEAELVHALEVTDGIPAVRARLFATATVELGEDRAEAAETLLASAAPSPETSVARSLLSLSRGRATEALMMLEALEASGVTLAEGARARALALGAMGRAQEAQAAAGQAWGFRPQGPRHACLLAHAAALAGDTATADATLRGIADAEARPCARVVRAELALARNDLTAADSEASVVLGALAERATAGEEAWAHHVRGRAAQLRGDTASARAEHRAAGQSGPPSDETLMLGALDGLVAAGDGAAAHELAPRLTAEAPNPQRRAETLVAIALEQRDFAGADAALRILPPGARTELARGRVLEAQGDAQGALMRYTAASVDASLAVEAALRRARLLSRLGRDAEARQALEHGARSAPADPAVATALAHAALATDDVTTARQAVTQALAAHPTDARLLVLSALVRARESDPASALQTARQAAATAPEDAELQLDLAEIARLAGDRATETTACASALRIEPQRFAATMCVVRTALEAGELPRATQLLEQARSAGAPEPQLSRMRAELAVASGHGQLDVDTVQGFLRTQRNDVPLLVALARLQLQAEDGNDADDTARRILSLSPENPEALYVRAYVAYVDGHFSSAAELLQRVERASRASSLQARTLALRGMLAFEESRYGNPAALADQALALDPRCATAHLLKALVAGSGNRDAQRSELMAATQGTDTPAEAVARLALALGPTGEGCALAERYVRMAPDGYDRRDVDDVRARCR